MALDNLISVVITDDEVEQVNEGAASISDVLAGKTVSLTPEQRRQHGRIANQNKLLVDKAKMYMEQNAQWIPGFLDKEEFDRDYDARTKIELMLSRLENLTQQLIDTKTLLDHDNYNNSLSFYRYLRYLANENEPGAGAAYRAIKQLFNRTNNSPEGKEDEDEGIPELEG